MESKNEATENGTEEHIYLSVSEYATREGVTDEAIRKQIRRYTKNHSELSEHIMKDSTGKLLLDEKAIEFLDEKRRGNPIVLRDMSKDEEIDRLKMENKKLLAHIAEIESKNSDQLTSLIEQNKKLQDRVLSITDKSNEDIRTMGQLEGQIKEKDIRIQLLTQQLQEEQSKNIFQRMFGKKEKKVKQTEKKGNDMILKKHIEKEEEGNPFIFGTSGGSRAIHSFKEEEFYPDLVPTYIKFYTKETNKETGEVRYSFSDNGKLDKEEHLREEKENEFFVYESIENKNFKEPEEEIER